MHFDERFFGSMSIVGFFGSLWGPSPRTKEKLRRRKQVFLQNGAPLIFNPKRNLSGPPRINNPMARPCRGWSFPRALTSPLVLCRHRGKKGHPEEDLRGWPHNRRPPEPFPLHPERGLGLSRAPPRGEDPPSGPRGSCAPRWLGCRKVSASEGFRDAAGLAEPREGHARSAHLKAFSDRKRRIRRRRAAEIRFRARAKMVVLFAVKKDFFFPANFQLCCKIHFFFF